MGDCLCSRLENNRFDESNRSHHLLKGWASNRSVRGPATVGAAGESPPEELHFGRVKLYSVTRVHRCERKGVDWCCSLRSVCEKQESTECEGVSFLSWHDFFSSST